MNTFAEFDLSAQVLDAVAELGYETPTPVQELAIPLVLSGQDLIAAAKTGTGKTAAFSLPLLSRLGHARRHEGPLALVVTPTRELAMQIADTCQVVARHTGHHIVSLIGGVSYNPQIEALSRGCDLIISTPGRLIDLMDQEAADLAQVETLVLDEADRMLDMGFLPDVRRIVAACPTNRQTLLFSATVDSAIEGNLANLLHEPAFVEIAKKGETADLIDQYRIDVDHRMKQDLLHALLREKGSKRVIVFARTRYRVDACVRKLLREGFNASAIHSSRTQSQRKHALDAFAADETEILVATDVLARGIDISKVNYVVNFDVPTQAEDYIHRIGRTGRAGDHGFAVTFVSPENKSEIAEIEHLIGSPIPLMRIGGFDHTKNDDAIAAKANRKAARKDPEIELALKEQKARARQKQKAKSNTQEPKRTGSVRKASRTAEERSRTKRQRRRKNVTTRHA